MYTKDFGHFKRALEEMLKQPDVFNDALIENQFGLFLNSDLPPTDRQMDTVLGLISKHRTSIDVGDLRAQWVEWKSGHEKKMDTPK